MNRATELLLEIVGGEAGPVTEAKSEENSHKKSKLAYVELN